MQRPLHTWTNYDVGPTFCLCDQWCRIHYPPFDRRGKQGPEGCRTTRSQESQFKPGQGWHLGSCPLLSIFLGGSTENLSPHTGLTAWIYKQSGKGHLMRKQNVFKRAWKKNKKRGLGLAWSYIHFFLTWKVASYRYYFVVCFFYLSVCPRNLSISVLEEF